MNYTPFWIKTDYSILSSLIKIDDLILKFKELNITSAAICDDNLFGAMEFYIKCKKNGVKPIIGLEINLPNPILLYAKNYEGYQNLCIIDTLKNKEELDIDLLKKYLDNLIIIIPFEFKEEVKTFNDYDAYIGYDENDDVSNIKKRVYIKKILTLNKEDEKYLTYLYKIKEEDYKNNKDVNLNYYVNLDDIKTTELLSDLCNLKIVKNNKLIPIYNTDSSFDEEKYLTDLCILGLKKRLDNNVSDVYVKRLKHELDIIIKMGFCNYFLVVWDYVKYAKKNNILVGPGRGSAASSLVSYSLGITNIDPIKYNLLFERFLNPSRVTMPDIDIDFDAEKRDDVIKYVINKYGKEKVCGIITFSNLLSKQVIRDVARILNVSGYIVDMFVKSFDDNKTLNEQLKLPGVKSMLQNNNELQKVFDISTHLEGLKRHVSQHAAGVIISSYNLSSYVPLLLNPDGSYLCGYTKDYIEDLGLLKMDFLGLKNLSMVDEIINKVNVNFNSIPLDDKKTFDLFKSADLTGVFQFETAGMKSFIERLKPTNINDLVAAVALFRPGPMDNIDHFIKRKNNEEQAFYINDDVKEILKDTYGIIVYQEQIMLIANKMAGFSLKEADDLRYATSKKKEDLLLSYKEKFIKGCLNNGYDEATSINTYDMILKFASYGFNKAHSVSYAILGYKIAYLKANYTNYFMCEILNSNIGAINKTKSLISECKKFNIEINKPSINNAHLNYEVIKNKIIVPLSIIKNIGTITARNIIEEKDKNGLYKSYIDFVKRCYKLGKDVIKNVILSGLLDEFKLTKKTMIENLDDIINYAELLNDLDESLVLEPSIKEYEEYESDELVKNEIALYGFYISNHPTSKYINENSVTTKDLNKFFDKNIKIILYFEKRKDINTKNNDKMMFIEGSDSYGLVKLVCFPLEYQNYFNIKVPGLYEVDGKVEKRFSEMQIIINSLKNIK